MNSENMIPIQNIYYLLCYAWDRLEERDIVEVNAAESPTILNLFARVLISGLSRLLTLGIDRGYASVTEESPVIKGRLAIVETLSKNLLRYGRAICSFDVMNYDILHNQILKSTIRLLSRSETIDKEHKRHFSDFLRRLTEVSDIVPTISDFNRIVLHKNNRIYLFLLSICELIWRNLLTTEKSGLVKFKDFIRDDSQMAQLFESFIRNFYRKEAVHCRVGSEYITWDAIPRQAEAAGYLPKMVTDISITGPTQKIIIDAKYYRAAFALHYDHEKIHSSHLYQIFSYLKNLESAGGINKDCVGVLLYPTVHQDIRLKYDMQNHLIMVRTLNLHQHWQLIHRDLIELLREGMSGAG